MIPKKPGPELAEKKSRKPKPLHSRYRSVKQVADYCNVTEKCVRAWLDHGKLPYTQIMGRLIQIDQADVDSIIHRFDQFNKKPSLSVRKDHRKGVA